MEGIADSPTFEDVSAGFKELFRTHVPEPEPIFPIVPEVLSESERRKLPKSDPRYLPGFLEWTISPVTGAVKAVTDKAKSWIFYLIGGLIIIALIGLFVYGFGSRIAGRFE